MAKNREPEKPVESDTESGEEDEESGSSDSDLESEQGKSQFLKKTLQAPKKSQPPTTPNPQKPESSSEDEDSGSGSDSEGPNIKFNPLASKPVDSPLKSSAVGKLRSKSTATAFPTPAKSTGATAEGKDTEAKESKRAKKKPEPQSESPLKKSALAGDESKKQLFQRVWNEDDEIAILEGLAEYAEKKKSDPVADLNAFHDFIKKNLHVDVTRSQLQDKIRRLKKKYVNNKTKEKDGKNMFSSKPHEQKVYELSKFVWGSEKGKETGAEKVVGSPMVNGVSARKNPSRIEDGNSKEVKSLENEDDEVTVLGSKRLISNSESVEERILRVGAEFFEGDKKLDGAREWKKLRQEEVELHLKKLDLLRAQTKLVLDVLKST